MLKVSIFPEFYFKNCRLNCINSIAISRNRTWAIGQRCLILRCMHKSYIFTNSLKNCQKLEEFSFEIFSILFVLLRFDCSSLH